MRVPRQQSNAVEEQGSQQQQQAMSVVDGNRVGREDTASTVEQPATGFDASSNGLEQQSDNRPLMKSPEQQEQALEKRRLQLQQAKDVVERSGHSDRISRAHSGEIRLSESELQQQRLTQQSQAQALILARGGEDQDQGPAWYDKYANMSADANVAMANANITLAPEQWPPFSKGDGSATSNYYMGLKLLEQQMRKREMMLARQEQLNRRDEQNMSQDDRNIVTSEPIPGLFGQFELAMGKPVPTPPDIQKQLKALEEHNKKRLMLARKQRDQEQARNRDDENISLDGNVVMASEQSHPVPIRGNSAMADYELSLTLREQQLRKRAMIASQEQLKGQQEQHKSQDDGNNVTSAPPPPGFSTQVNTAIGEDESTGPDYQTQLRMLEEQNKKRLRTAKGQQQNRGQQGDDPTRPDYQTQLRMLEEQNRKRLTTSANQQQPKRRQAQHISAESSSMTARDHTALPFRQILAAPNADGRALADYQMQMTLLEYQKQKRIRMEKERQQAQPPQPVPTEVSDSIEREQEVQEQPYHQPLSHPDTLPEIEEQLMSADEQRRQQTIGFLQAQLPGLPLQDLNQIVGFIRRQPQRDTDVRSLASEIQCMSLKDLTRIVDGHHPAMTLQTSNQPATYFLSSDQEVLRNLAQGEKNRRIAERQNQTFHNGAIPHGA